MLNVGFLKVPIFTYEIYQSWLFDRKMTSKLLPISSIFGETNISLNGRINLFIPTEWISIIHVQYMSKFYIIHILDILKSGRNAT